MTIRHPGRRRARRLVGGTLLAAGLVPATAGAATTATFSGGVLTVAGDSTNNTIVLGRDAAGTILVNNGAVAVGGGTPTVATTTLVRAYGLGGADVIRLDEANGPLPAASLYGGDGPDALTGGAAADQLFGQAGNDTLNGKGGGDGLFGGGDDDVLTGGSGNDQVYGQSGNDRLVWTPGDGSDLDEGGDGTDVVRVYGETAAEQFTVTANGGRVRLDRLSPAAFTLDIGTTENVGVVANGGDDSFSAVGDLASLTTLTVDGGAGNDQLLGGNGADVLYGGDGNDLVDGRQGNDMESLGAGDDQVIWDPGDASDTVEGGAGIDALRFNGSNASENIAIAANGPRVRLTRDIATVTMDLNSVEAMSTRLLGGTDSLAVGDLTGTGATSVAADLGAFDGTDDGVADTMSVSATSADDLVTVTGAGTTAQVTGLSAPVSVDGAYAPNDRLVVNGLAGSDTIDASGVSAGAAMLTLDGGDNDDVLIGGDGDDTLVGGAGDDVLIGGPGNDTFDGGTGDNVVLDTAAATAIMSATVAGPDWQARHVRTVGGRTVLDVGGRRRTLPRALAG
jgi:Ca2+-binding RTX toxin-like protein